MGRFESEIFSFVCAATGRSKWKDRGLKGRGRKWDVKFTENKKDVNEESLEKFRVESEVRRSPSTLWASLSYVWFIKHWLSKLVCLCVRLCVCVRHTLQIRAGGKAARKQASIMLIESACWCVCMCFLYERACLLKCTRVCLLEGGFRHSLKFEHTELVSIQAVDPRQIM